MSGINPNRVIYPDNLFDRVAALERQIAIVQSTPLKVSQLSSLADDMGAVYLGNFFSGAYDPATGLFTGGALSSPGYYDATTNRNYVVYTVNAGVLQCGLSTDDGAFIAGAGTFRVDVNGPGIISGSAYSSQQSYKFIDAAGNTLSALSSYITYGGSPLNTTRIINNVVGSSNEIDIYTEVSGAGAAKSRLEAGTLVSGTLASVEAYCNAAGTNHVAILADTITLTGTVATTGKQGITANIAPAAGADRALGVDMYAYSGAGTQWMGEFVRSYTVAGQSTVAQIGGVYTCLYHSAGYTLADYRGIETGGMYVDGAGSVVTMASGITINGPICTNSGAVTTYASIYIPVWTFTGITNYYTILSERTWPSSFKGPIVINENSGMALDVYREAAPQCIQISSYYEATTPTSTIYLRGARGTHTSPGDVLADDYIGELDFWGYNNAAFRKMGQIRCRVAATQSATSYPADMYFGVVPDGSTAVNIAMTIRNSGYVGIGTVVPGNRLDVSLPTGNSINQGINVTGQNGGQIALRNATSTSSEFEPRILGVSSAGLTGSGSGGLYIIGRTAVDNANNTSIILRGALPDYSGKSTASPVLQVQNYTTTLLTIAYDGLVTIATNLQVTTGFGCNSKTAQTAYASGGAVVPGAGAYGFDSAVHAAAVATLLTNIRAALVANGIMS